MVTCPLNVLVLIVVEWPHWYISVDQVKLMVVLLVFKKNCDIQMTFQRLDIVISVRLRSCLVFCITHHTSIMESFTISALWFIRLFCPLSDITALHGLLAISDWILHISVVNYVSFKKYLLQNFSELFLLLCHYIQTTSCREYLESGLMVSWKPTLFTLSLHYACFVNTHRTVLHRVVTACDVLPNSGHFQLCST